MTPEESRKALARLLALCALSEARVKANPLPFLNRVAGENARLRAAIDEALFHLSGASAFDVAQEDFPALPPGIVETALGRMDRAATTLADALKAANRQV